MTKPVMQVTTRDGKLLLKNHETLTIVAGDGGRFRLRAASDGIYIRYGDEENSLIA